MKLNGANYTSPNSTAIEDGNNYAVLTIHEFLDFSMVSRVKDFDLVIEFWFLQEMTDPSPDPALNDNLRPIHSRH